MKFKIRAKGHKNVTSLHKSTFEITKDVEIGPTADCIVGVNMDNSMFDFPIEFKKKIADSNTKITIILDSENGHDEIIGYGHENLTLTIMARLEAGQGLSGDVEKLESIASNITDRDRKSVV